MNIDYNSVIDKTSVTAKMLYKENTHAFAYYILTAAFMNNILDLYDGVQSIIQNGYSFIQLIEHVNLLKGL